MKTKTLLNEFFRYVILNGSGLMFGMGGATKYSIYRGQKNKSADKCFSNTIYIMSILVVIFMLAGSFSNIILDYVFIFPLHMGIFGTVLATGIAPVISLCIQLQQIAETGLKLYFTAIPFVGFNIIISSYFTSIEKALPAQIISLSRGFLVIIPMTFFLLSFLLKMTGVWLSFPITECFVALAGIALYIKSERGKKNV